MAKRTFKDINALEKYLTGKTVVNSVFANPRVRKLLAKEMSEQVHRVVYAKYTPREYERRENKGGLSDMRNMKFTKVEINGNKVRILFENLTTGQKNYIPIYEQFIDSLDGQFITDTIVDYKPQNWIRPHVKDEQGRQPSTPRDFIASTIQAIQANPTPLINAIKDSYRKLGLEVK